MEKYYWVKSNGNIKYNGQYIFLNEKVCMNPTDSQLREAGYERVFTGPRLVTLEDFIEDKIADLDKYDTSNNVNSFSIGGATIWLPQAKRVGLMLRIQAEESMGLTHTTLWYEGYEFNFEIPQLKQALLAVEAYASACFDVTERHRQSIQALKTIDEVKAYDFTKGYPEKLVL